MDSKLVKARKHHICSACGQLIVPGELYCAQRWAPWELEDGDGHYWSQPACRWCADRVWSAFRGDLWSAEFLDEWVWEEMWRWLQLAGVEMDWTIPAEYKQPLRAAQKAARAVLERTRNRASLIAFYRAIGVDPWAEWTPEDRWNRVATCTPAGYLYRCGFRRSPEGGLDHMLDTSGFPGQEWWRCGGCNQHPCSCTCPMPLTYVADCVWEEFADFLSVETFAEVAGELREAMFP